MQLSKKTPGASNLENTSGMQWEAGGSKHQPIEYLGIQMGESKYSSGCERESVTYRQIEATSQSLDKLEREYQFR